MIKLSPIHCEKIWGYEDWIASTHKDGLQKDFYEFCGGEFPLLVKIIQSKDFLSVQVHPDDENASRLEKVGAKGKTECWYVLEADENAKIVYGLNEVSSVEDLRKSIENGTFGHKLNYVRVKAGDFFFIPAGTIHAIGSGLKILEIQQSSNITYRIFDWNRGRKLDVEKALQVMAKAALEDGIKLLVSSTYRSYSYQEKLFARWVAIDGLEEAERESARPGTSQHQLGSAIDFGSITDDFDETSMGKWLYANASKYGWSLSFPKNYEDITGYRWECWHFRYIGVPACQMQRKWFGNVQQYMLEFIDLWKKY